VGKEAVENPPILKEKRGKEGEATVIQMARFIESPGEERG